MKQFFTLFVFLLSIGQLCAQTFTINGYISDESSGEKLIGANIRLKQTSTGTVTNQYGFYSFSLSQDNYELVVSYIGYETAVIPLLLDKDITLNIELGASISLETVEVVGKIVEEEIATSQMSQLEVPIDQIKKIPTFLGEADVLKVLQLLPGVQSGGEGQTGLYVRGGSPDQNLVLLDGVPVYNLSHLLGFYSIFNADAIKNVTLTKGGIPARYGGRLSSVLNISMKEGNMNTFKMRGDIGMISSKLTIEGPIKKNKSSFLLSGRRTYIDLLMGPIVRGQGRKIGEDIDLTLFFYDLNAKFNYKINNKHQLYLSSYSGSDVFGFGLKKNFNEKEFTRFSSQIDWGNRTTAFRWNYMTSNKLFVNTTLTYSRFSFNLFADNASLINDFSSEYANRFSSGINDLAGKVNVDFIPNPKHYIRFGGSVTHHTYEPGVLQYSVSTDGTSPINSTFGEQDLSALEYQLYIEDDMKLGRVKMNLGLHSAIFQIDGQTYTSLQPRLSINYSLNKHLAFKGAYTAMTQYINLLTNEGLGIPTDLWVPSTSRIKPQNSTQTSLGISTTLKYGLSLNLEAYYKKMNNVVAYKEGASFFGVENNWQDKITQGKGEAYGVELFLQKKEGNTTGWIGYTLSWNWRQFEELNNGKVFPFRYDRRHDISFVLNHKINKRLSFSGAWVYGTGNAITLPLYRYTTTVVNSTGDLIFEEVENNEARNSFRMPNYHRADINIELANRKNEDRRLKSFWSFGVYNLYNRKNPYFLSATQNENGERIFEQTSLLGLTPSVVYRFEF